MFFFCLCERSIEWCEYSLCLFHVSECLKRKYGVHFLVLRMCRAHQSARSLFPVQRLELDRRLVLKPWRCIGGLGSLVQTTKQCQGRGTYIHLYVYSSYFIY